MRSPNRSCASSNLRSGALIIFVVAISGNANAREPRARDLGVPFPGETGVFNAITDVEGVEVGHTTIVHGDGVDRKKKLRFRQCPITRIPLS